MILKKVKIKVKEETPLEILLYMIDTYHGSAAAACLVPQRSSSDALKPSYEEENALHDSQCKKVKIINSQFCRKGCKMTLVHHMYNLIRIISQTDMNSLRQEGDKNLDAALMNIGVISANYFSNYWSYYEL